MDSFEVNKIVGAGLMSLLIAVVIGHIGDILLPTPELAKPAIAVPAAAEAPATAAPAAPKPFAALLASASADEGKNVARACQACHNLQKGQGAKIGPDLWGVVGAKVGEGTFAFSDAIKKLGGVWTFDRLNEWLTDPQKMAPGTKMTFPGIKDDQQRADVIAYLRTLSDNPMPLPKAPAPAPAAKAPAKAAAAGQGTPAPAGQTAAAGTPAAGSKSFTAMVASANVDEGKSTARVCEMCHNLEKGKGPKIGPDLWNVVGAKVGEGKTFEFSDAVKKLGGDWTYDRLNEWLTDPQKMAPGTKMTFAGIKDEQKRADVVAYLRTLSDHPAPLPGK